MNTSSTQPIALSSRVRYRAVDAEGVLVHLENGRVIVVNEVGLYILQQLDSPKTLSALAELVAEEFSIALGQAQEDIERYLVELNAEQVLGG